MGALPPMPDHSNFAECFYAHFFCSKNKMKRVPRWLTAELTHRCPLQCFYCSNPINMTVKNELKTEEWVRVFQEARDMGSVQLGLTGGEP